MINLSCSPITRVRFCGPPITRSIASSSVAFVIIFWSVRAVSNAASFKTFAKSAPENPGVRRATAIRSTSSSSGLPFACTANTSRRPTRSGTSTAIWRSKRPGRSKAGSKMSGRFVAAIRITPVLPSKPSISTSIWFSVCSRSSWPPPIPAPR